MGRPKKLTAASIDFKIKWVDQLNEAMGEFRESEQTIYILSSLSRQSARHVLWHEVKHAIWWAYNFNPDTDDLEESIVSMSGGPEVETLRNNPKVAEYIFGD